MATLSKIFVVLIIFMMPSFSAFASDNLDKQKEAMDVIVRFADSICGYYQDQGSSKTLDVSGEINAGLKGLLKNLADIGITGTAAYKDNSFQGVLQKDLAELLKDQIKCKSKVAELFIPLVPMGNSTSGVPSEPSVADPAQKLTLTGRWNSVFGPVEFTQQGQSLTGTLYYAVPPLKEMGATANIKGKLAEKTLTFVWWVFADTPENPTGRGVLTLSDDGNLLDGHITDKNNPGGFAPWQLVRDKI